MLLKKTLERLEESLGFTFNPEIYVQDNFFVSHSETSETSEISEILEPVDVEEDGLITKAPRNKLQYVITTDVSKAPAGVFFVTLQNCDGMKLVPIGMRVDDGQILKKVRVKSSSTRTDRTFLATFPLENNFRVFDTRERIFRMWDVGIVVQYGHAFLVVQKNREGHMYDDDGKILISEREFPGFARWDGLRRFLAERVMVNDLSCCRDKSALTEFTGKDHAIPEFPFACIDFYSMIRGTGQAETIVDGELKRGLVYWKNVPERKHTSLRYLEAGDVFRANSFSKFSDSSDSSLDGEFAGISLL